MKRDNYYYAYRVIVEGYGTNKVYIPQIRNDFLWWSWYSDLTSGCTHEEFAWGCIQAYDSE